MSARPFLRGARRVAVAAALCAVAANAAAEDDWWEGQAPVECPAFWRRKAAEDPARASGMLLGLKAAASRDGVATEAWNQLRFDREFPRALTEVLALANGESVAAALARPPLDAARALCTVLLDTSAKTPVIRCAAAHGLGAGPPASESCEALLSILCRIDDDPAVRATCAGALHGPGRTPRSAGPRLLSVVAGERDARVAEALVPLLGEVDCAEAPDWLSAHAATARGAERTRLIRALVASCARAAFSRDRGFMESARAAMNRARGDDELGAAAALCAWRWLDPPRLRAEADRMLGDVPAWRRSCSSPDCRRLRAEAVWFDALLAGRPPGAAARRVLDLLAEDEGTFGVVLPTLTDRNPRWILEDVRSLLLSADARTRRRAAAVAAALPDPDEASGIRAAYLDSARALNELWDRCYPETPLAASIARALAETEALEDVGAAGEVAGAADVQVLDVLASARSRAVRRPAAQEALRTGRVESLRAVVRHGDAELSRAALDELVRRLDAESCACLAERDAAGFATVLFGPPRADSAETDDAVAAVGSAFLEGDSTAPEFALLAADPASGAPRARWTSAWACLLARRGEVAEIVRAGLVERLASGRWQSSPATLARLRGSSDRAVAEAARRRAAAEATTSPR